MHSHLPQSPYERRAGGRTAPARLVSHFRSQEHNGLVPLRPLARFASFSLAAFCTDKLPFFSGDSDHQLVGHEFVFIKIPSMDR